MTILHLQSPAKVNLTLDVLGRDEATGYHFVQTILHEVPALFDELTFELRADSDITLTCDHPDLPTDDTNLVLRAAHLLQKKYNIQKGARIHLKKNIPPKSGLGGGSSNAATTLKALNQLWELGLSDNTLRELAIEIGMDVPFFITGGCALGMHYGEQLEHLPTLDYFGYAIEILEIFFDSAIAVSIADTATTRATAVSTREAYAQLNSGPMKPIDPGHPTPIMANTGERNRDTGRLVAILKKKGPPTPLELEEIPQLLHNDFELLHGFSPKAHLSGSGGARFRLVRLA